MTDTPRAAGYDLWFERIGEDEYTTVVIEEGAVKHPKQRRLKNEYRDTNDRPGGGNSDR